MAYVPVPKDLSKIKPKFAFNLTLRQLVCLGGGALVGVPLYFYLKPHTGSSFAAFCMIAVLVPAFLIGLFEYQGQPLEKVLSQVIRVRYLRPQRRHYETNNLYKAAVRQAKYDEEVKQILYGEKTIPHTKKATGQTARKISQKEKQRAVRTGKHPVSTHVQRRSVPPKR